MNEILKGTERKLVELLLTESVIVSKRIEDQLSCLITTQDLFHRKPVRLS